MSNIYATPEQERKKKQEKTNKKKRKKEKKKRKNLGRCDSEKPMVDMGI